MPEFAADAALYFDPQEPKQLANLLAYVLDDPALMMDLAARAQQRASLYDWHRTAMTTWDAIVDLCRN
jgi:glycosyltransferase involved in cell wall biosynthesis